MNRAYAPRGDSVVVRVLDWFKKNPAETLSTDALEAKFDKPAKQWHSILALAVEAGLLKRAPDEEEELVYSLGSGQAPSAKSGAASQSPVLDSLWGGANLGLKPKANGTRSPKAPFICDPLSFTIHSDRPMPLGSGKGRFGTDWTPLFAKLQVGQSVDVPEAARPSLAKQMSDSKKAGTGEFMLRKINDETFGLWRVK